MYAGQSLSHSLKYAILPGLGGPLYGSTVVGYLTWAHQLAALPNQFSQLVSRVNYPALSHLQHERDRFDSLAAESLAWTCRLVFPAFAVLIGLAPQITEHVYGEKWLPAVPALVLLSFSMALSCVAGVLLPALYSLGRERTGTTIALGWTALTWLIAGVLAFAGFDFNSIAWGYLMASAIALVCTLYALRDLGVAGLLVPLVLPALTAGAIMLILWLFGPGLVHNLLSLVIAAVLGGALALAVNLWPARAQALRFMKTFTDSKRRPPDASIPEPEQP
jgi:O-antigen/teichoic acid export membrane protein